MNDRDNEAHWKLDRIEKSLRTLTAVVQEQTALAQQVGALKKALRNLLVDAQAQVWDGEAARDAQALLDQFDP